MRKPLLVGSIVVHGIAFSALAIVAFWRIEKVPVDYNPGVVASFALPRDPGGGAAPKVDKLVPEKVKVVPKDVVQPKIEKEERHDTNSAAADKVGDSTSGPAGNGGGGNGQGKGLVSTGCDTGVCTDTKTTIDVPPPITKVEIKKTEVKREIIAESQVKRIAGDKNIGAPDSVKVQMQRDDVSRVIASVRVCADKAGTVTSATIQKSTGYDAYDDKITSAMSKFRYEPYHNKDGEPAPFCTSVQLVYIMR